MTTKAWKWFDARTPDDLLLHNLCKKIVKGYSFDCFIDIGAGYLGAEAWSINKLLPDCRIIGFEPQTEKYEVMLPHFPGELHKKAVTDVDGIIEGAMGYRGGKTDTRMHSPEVTYQGGYHLPSGAYKPSEIESVTIDSLVVEKGLDEFFIWADIEGCELRMLKGAVKALEEKKIVGLNLEINFRPASDPNHCTKEEVLDFLDRFGYAPVDLPKDFKTRGGHRDVMWCPK